VQLFACLRLLRFESSELDEAGGLIPRRNSDGASSIAVCSPLTNDPNPVAMPLHISAENSKQPLASMSIAPTQQSYRISPTNKVRIRRTVGSISRIRLPHAVKKSCRSDAKRPCGRSDPQVKLVASTPSTHGRINIASFFNGCAKWGQLGIEAAENDGRAWRQALL
jgi:hypothetical protein